MIFFHWRISSAVIGLVSGVTSSFWSGREMSNQPMRIVTIMDAIPCGSITKPTKRGRRDSDRGRPFGLNGVFFDNVLVPFI